MRRLFLIGIGLSGFLSNLFELVSGFFPEHPLHSLIVGKFCRVLFLDRAFISFGHSGDLPC